ncbi:MAG: hypothetical protein AB1650_04580 [Candidatus Omnitrophota bacterium]
MSYRKPKYVILRMSLVAILVSLFFWSYFMFSENYERVELSQKMVAALLDDETELARKYARELGLVQANLERTELFLADIKMENMKLKEKIRLLDELNEMERQIGSLKDENVLIKEEMLKISLEKNKLEKQQKFASFDTLEEGKGFIFQFKQKIREVKQRIAFLKKEEYKKKVAFQQEIDRNESLLGNNGYLVKDGKPMPMGLPEVMMTRDVKVNVEFVK